MEGANLSDFSYKTNCGASLAAHTACYMGLYFNPTATGARNGVLNVADSAQNSPQAVTLYGWGNAAAGHATGNAAQ